MDEQSQSPAPARRKLGRAGLIVWLLTPLVIVVVMWLMIDRSKGKPDPRLMNRPPGAAPTATDAVPLTQPPK